MGILSWPLTRVICGSLFHHGSYPRFAHRGRNLLLLWRGEPQPRLAWQDQWEDLSRLAADVVLGPLCLFNKKLLEHKSPKPSAALHHMWDHTWGHNGSTSSFVRGTAASPEAESYDGILWRDSCGWAFINKYYIRKLHISRCLLHFLWHSYTGKA